MADHFKENQNQKVAEKELLEFIGQYCLLIEAQINAVRKDMEKTVDSVMSSLSGISQKQSEKTHSAESLLVLETTGKGVNQKVKGFQKAQVVSVEEKENATTPQVSSKNLSMGIKKTGVRLKDYMKNLDELDSKMKDLVFKMIGALSTDDVVGQKLEHVSKAMEHLKQQLNRVISNYKEELKPERIEAINHELQNKVYHEYSMHSERSAFIKVFGHPPEDNK